MEKELSDNPMTQYNHDRPAEQVSGGRYLVQMYGGLEPEIRGPFPTEDKRDRAAK
jgi:hypothetical protein